MLSDANYSKILNYFDRQFWSIKTDETNWQYNGIILDWYFESSVFCIDYLDISDYFTATADSAILKLFRLLNSILRLLGLNAWS